MSAKLGSGSTVGYSPDNIVAYVNIGKVESADMPGTDDMVEVTSNDSGGSKEYLSGNRDHTLTFKCVYDVSDTGQLAIIAAYYAGTLLYYKYRPAVATGEKQKVAQGRIKSLTFPSQNNQKIELSVTVQITGAVTISAQ